MRKTSRAKEWDALHITTKGSTVKSKSYKHNLSIGDIISMEHDPYKSFKGKKKKAADEILGY